ncbi:MAG: NAD(P)-binding protein [Desulfobacterales bacterium]|nr:NAD(P)-binding protein [Desulfobacterales bacterium]
MKKAVVIGGGFAGCTITLILKQKGFDVTLVEGSPVLGGGCRTFFYHGHPYTEGPHHLLINIDEMYVWEFLDKFVKLRELKHHTLTYVSQDSRFYTYPIHQDEIVEMPDKEKIYKEIDHRCNVKESKNFEEYWINSIGQTLYEKFIKTYSLKMWGIKNNKEIDEFAYSPKGATIKTGSKQCFEGKKIIGYPLRLDGYNSYFDMCVEGCKVIYNVFINKFDLENKRVWAANQWISGDVIINTSSPDGVFDYCFGELRYIGRDFLKIILPVKRIIPEPYFYLHYPGEEENYTRIVEYKLLTGYESLDTLIGIEFPSFKNKLYPYPIRSEIEKAEKYIKLFPKNTYSIGRMGKYKYDNMSEVIKDCLNLKDSI